MARDSFENRRLRAEMAKAAAHQRVKKETGRKGKAAWKEQREANKSVVQKVALGVIWALVIVAGLVGLYRLGFIRTTPSALSRALKDPATRKLDLNLAGLGSLPSKLGEVTALAELNVAQNELNALPPELGQLKKLRVLRAGYNNLSEFPPELTRLESLQILDLKGNKLEDSSDSFGSLEQLRELNLSRNRLTSIPWNLGELKELKSLDLSSNQLTTIPETWRGSDGA